MMKFWRTIRTATILAACLGLVLPQLALGAGPASIDLRAQSNGVIDVALQMDGRLRGHVLDGQGRSLAGASITIGRNKMVVLRSTTDDRGQFAASNLRGGVYEVTVGTNTSIIRVWAPRTAPPSAVASLVLVEHGVVRGQDGGGLFGFGGLSNPWFVGGIILTSIVVPIAIESSDDNYAS